MGKLYSKECKKIHDRITQRWHKIGELWDKQWKNETCDNPQQQLHQQLQLQMDALKKENDSDWELYISNIPVQKILKELNKLPRYKYPPEQSSAFLLPDGKMVGNDILFNHCMMLEKIVGTKLGVQLFFHHLVALRAIKLTVSDSVLYININTYTTKKQETVLKNLGKSEKYKHYALDTDMCHIVSKTDVPDSSYIYDLLGLEKPEYPLK